MIVQTIGKTWKPKQQQPTPSNRHTWTILPTRNAGTNKRNQHQQKRKAQPKKRAQMKTSEFQKKSKEAALAQTKFAKAKQRQVQLSNSSRVQLDTTQFRNNKSIEVINLASDSSQGSPITIFTSNHTEAFMTTPSTQKPKDPARTNRKMNKIGSSSTKQPRQETEQLITIIPADHSTPTEEKTATKRANEPHKTKQI